VSSIGLEYKGRELLVFHQMGMLGLGADRIPEDLKQPVINELVKRAGLGRKSREKCRSRLRMLSVHANRLGVGIPCWHGCLDHNGSQDKHLGRQIRGYPHPCQHANILRGARQRLPPPDGAKEWQNGAT